MTHKFVLSFALPFPLLRSPRKYRQGRGRTSVLQRERGMDARPWNVLAITALVVFVLTYLALVNGNATAGYELRTREERVNELRDITRRLELKTIAGAAEERLTARIAERGFVPVASLRYLNGERAVAK